ncbi:MAG: addiction module antidote protein [Myxococcota bacterium]
MPTVPYRDRLLERLADPTFAAGYLTACLEEGDEVFLLGLRDVVDAQGGMAHLAKATGLNRETLYRTLSEAGNPRLSSLGLIIEALGLRLSIDSPEDDPRAA